jgi:hypothetical protein
LSPYSVAQLGSYLKTVTISDGSVTFGHDSPLTVPEVSVNALPPVSIPRTVLTHLVTGLADDTAHKTLQMWTPGNVVHLGDPFGTVLAWMWRSDPGLAVEAVSTVLSQLRKWDELATQKITLDALLDGLPFAIGNLSDEELDDLVTTLRREVPKRFESDQNATE